MKVNQLAMSEVLVLEPKVFPDDRGFFYESFNQQEFNDIVGKDIRFVQDNHSYSLKGVLRGLHYQLPPMQQGKLVRVISGKVFDVAVDLRKSSPTFGAWVGEVLSGENKKQIWIPEGFAHAFLTLSETAEILYKTTSYYAPQLERCIAWNDPSINIIWPENIEPRLSTRDASAAKLEEADLYP